MKCVRCGLKIEKEYFSEIDGEGPYCNNCAMIVDLKKSGVYIPGSESFYYAEFVNKNDQEEEIS